MVIIISRYRAKFDIFHKEFVEKTNNQSVSQVYLSCNFCNKANTPLQMQQRRMYTAGGYGQKPNSVKVCYLFLYYSFNKLWSQLIVTWWRYYLCRKIFGIVLPLEICQNGLKIFLFCRVIGFLSGTKLFRHQ